MVTLVVDAAPVAAQRAAFCGVAETTGFAENVAGNVQVAGVVDWKMLPEALLASAVMPDSGVMQICVPSANRT